MIVPIYGIDKSIFFLFFLYMGYFGGTAVGTTRELLGNYLYLTGNYFEKVQFPL